MNHLPVKRPDYETPMKEVYFNNPQRRTQLIGANTTVIVAGRRTGKTDSIASPFVLRNMQRMPGSTGGIVVPTFKHGLTNTIPGLLAAWKRWGFLNGVHYVVGRKPPKGFHSAIIEPTDYEHVISFYNGSRAIIISQDRPGSSNSLTLSWLLIDEAKFIDYERLKDETLPANGGIKSYFGKHSFNHSILILSDMPQTKKGSWFLHYEDKMDRELIAAIEATVCEIWRIKQRIKSDREAGNTPPDYLRKHLRHLDRQLNQMRSVAVYYKEYSSIENLQLLGETYIKQMKRDLTPLTFQTSILCQRIGIAKDGFYSSMREAHFYDASNFAYLDKMWHEMFGVPDTNQQSVCGGESGGTSRFTDGEPSVGATLLPNAIADPTAQQQPLNTVAQDADVIPSAPICIGMDYNANINWIVAGQVYNGPWPATGRQAGQPVGKRLNVIKSFYTKFERKIPALIADFCAYYQDHQNKTVIFYYDTTALGSNYAVNEQDFRWVVIHEFERHGWRVHDVYIGNPMKHHEKYLEINEAFAGRRKLMPFLNRQNNEDLILALQTAGVSRGRNGFRKDKGGEKLAEIEEDLLQHRTDGTDAFDTLYIGCAKFPQRSTSPISISGVL